MIAEQKFKCPHCGGDVIIFYDYDEECFRHKCLRCRRIW